MNTRRRRFLALGGAQSAQNLVSNSVWAGGPPPTGWTQPFGTGTLTAVASSFVGHTAMQFAGTNQRPALQYSSVTAVAGQAFTIAFDVEAVVSGIRYDLLVGAVGVTASFIYPDGGSNATLLATRGRYRFVVNVTVGGSMSIRIGLGTNNVATGDITIARPQVHVGPVPRPYIMT